MTTIYQSYRQWRKARGRKKKLHRRLKARVSFYSKFIRSGDLCIDVGANIGNRTEAFLKLGARVIAVEPQRECIAILNEKFGWNENVVIVPKVLADTVGQAEIYAGTASTLTSMSKEWINAVKKSGRFAEHNWNKTHIVETTTLDILIQEYGKPVFCKIDVEGFEYNVLKGLSEPVSMISFEFTPESMDSTLNCIKYLSSLGMKKFNYSQAELMCFTLPDWKDAAEISEFLTKSPGDTSVFGDVYAKSS